MGTTSVHELRDPSDAAGSRYREILEYLGESAEAWVALDDDARLFPTGCAELILCADGFNHAEGVALRAALEKLHSSGSATL